ncbi:hypothetical protein D3C81_1677120 [compost metagenome]
MQPVISVVEQLETELIDQCDRRSDRYAQPGSVINLQMAIICMVSSRENAPARGFPTGKAIDPGNCVFVASIVFCGEVEELPKRVETDIHSIDTAGADGH